MPVQALGIPDRSAYGDVTNLPVNKLIDWIVQRHEAERAGCFSAFTPIRMADNSTKLLISINVGDLVLTPSGKRRVLKVWNNGYRQDWYRLSYCDVGIFATSNHPIACTDDIYRPVSQIGKKVLVVRGEINVREKSHKNKTLHNLRKINAEHARYAYLWKKLRRAARTYEERSKTKNRTNRRGKEELVLRRNKISSTTHITNMAKTARQRVACRAVYKQAIISRRNSRNNWMLSQRYKESIIETEYKYKRSEEKNRKNCFQNCWRKQLALEGWNLQWRTNGIAWWALSAKENKITNNRGTRTSMSVVWKERRTTRNTSSYSVSLCVAQQRRNSTLYKMPQRGRKSIQSCSSYILCCEQLSGFGGNSYDLEIEKEHCYYVVINGVDLLVHNSHRDYRFGTPQTGLFSFVSRKPMPKPGEKQLWIQQPLHSHEYKDFEGKIEEGYGKGTVSKEDEGKAIITQVGPNKIHFTLAHKKYPERFAMVQTDKYGKGRWLLMNTTPMGQTEGFEKPHFKVIPPDKVEAVLKDLGKGDTVQAKIDGSSTLNKVLKDSIEMLSYRKSKKVDTDIFHTERAFSGRPKLDIPKPLQGSVFRSELYATKDNKPIPLQNLGGLLNSNLQKTIEDKEKQNIQFKNMPFDILRYGKTPVNNLTTPHSERMDMLRNLLANIKGPQFQEMHHMPEEAKTPEDAQKLYNQISSGEHPLTDEGIVLHPETGTPSKSKIFQESDAYIRGFFPAQKGSKYENKGVGGFIYSHEPNSAISGEAASGLSDEMREMFHKDPNSFLGRKVRLKYTKKMPSGKLFQPVFMSLHEG